LAILDSRIDGFMENTILERDESGDKNRVVRATLQWKPTDAWDITLKMEDGSFDSEGRNVEAVNLINIPIAGVELRPYDILLKHLTAGQNVYLLDTTHDLKRQSNGDFSYNDTENITLNIEREVGELTFTSLTGYNAYTYDELCDCDFTGAPGFNILSNEEYDQLSQEFRITSPEDQTVSYIAGLFFQSSNLQFHDDIQVPKDSFIATALTTDLGAAAANLLRGASTQRDFEQDTSLYAAFGQATWNITDSFRTILGARYTTEKKEADRHQYHATPSGTILPVGTPTTPYNGLWGIFNVEPYDPIHGERDESSFTPLVTAQLDINGTDMLYASFTTGFKSGGFDVRANSHPDPTVNNSFNVSRNDSTVPPTVTVKPIQGTFEFEDEEVINYEIGGKFVLADGAAELNVALFRSEFSDMQTSQFDGGVSFNVTNAGEATVQGLEVDGRWAFTDGILLRGGFAFIDFEYTDFKNSQCYFGQEDPNGDNICDATGARREFTPELQGNAGVDYTINFSNGLKLVNTLDIIYSDDYLTTPSLDPKFEQEAYTKLNARIALSGNDDMWELALIGKNLTDESIVSYANGLPVASVLTEKTSSGYYAFYERPRSVAIQGTLKF
jgi:iron complex outermembrane receptor protein